MAGSMPSSASVHLVSGLRYDCITSRVLGIRGTFLSWFVIVTTSGVVGFDAASQPVSVCRLTVHGAGRRARLDRFGKRDARHAQLLGQQSAGLARAPVARLAADQHHVELAELANGRGQRLGHEQRIGILAASLTTSTASSALQRQRLAQHVFGAVGSAADGRDLAAVRFAKLQRRLQRVLAEDVRHQVGAAALGLALGGVDAKVAGRNLRIENLLDANDEVHGDRWPRTRYDRPSRPPAAMSVIASMTCSLVSRPSGRNQRGSHSSVPNRLNVATVVFTSRSLPLGAQRVERAAHEIEVHPLAIQDLLAMLGLEPFDLVGQDRDRLVALGQQPAVARDDALEPLARDRRLAARAR